MRSILFTIFLFSFLLIASSHAYNLNSTSKKQDSSFIDKSRTFISKQLFKITNSIDSIFGKKNSFQEANGSKLKIYYLFSKEEGQDFQQEPNFKLVLKFPEFQKKLKFKFEKRSTVPDQGNIIVEGPLETQITDSNDQADYTAGLGFIIKESKKWYFEIDSGLTVRIPLNPFLRSYARRSFFFRKIRCQLHPRIFCLLS